MADARLALPVVVLRSAPWPVVCGVTLAAALVFGLAGWLRHEELALMVALLGVGLCAGAAGYVLDEEAGVVADAAPVARLVRIAWRLPLAALPAVVGELALLWLDRLDPRTPWLHLAPVTVGGVALGLALSAALRRGGNPAPGDLVAGVALGAVVSVILADPLRRWVSLTSLQSAHYASRTALAWALIVLACSVVIRGCEADPGRRPARSIARKDVG